MWKSAVRIIIYVLFVVIGVKVIGIVNEKRNRVKNYNGTKSSYFRRFSPKKYENKLPYLNKHKQIETTKTTKHLHLNTETN